MAVVFHPPRGGGAIDFCRARGEVPGGRVVVPLSFSGFPDTAAAAMLARLDTALADVLGEYAAPGSAALRP